MAQLLDPKFEGQVASSTGQSPLGIGTSGDIGVRLFDGLSSKIGAVRDEVAQQEGVREGRVAGIDQSFRPETAYTIKGQAFQQAATATYLQNLQVKSRDEIFKTYDEFKALPPDQQTPDLLDARLRKLQQSFEDPKKGDVAPELLGQFRASFSGQAVSLQHQARTDFVKRTLQRSQAATENNLASLQDAGHRAASLTDDNGDQATAKAQAEFAETVRAAVAAGHIDPVTGEKRIRDNLQSLLKTRIVTQFNEADDAEKPKILKRFQESYAPDEKDVSGAALGPNAPAGMRNNNPGNIKYRGQKDAVGPSKNTDQGDPQAVYATPEDGMAAASRLALKKYNGGKTTAAQIIAGEGGWTPGNMAAAKNIAAGMGLGVNDDLELSDPDKRAKFLRALVTQEHGEASKAYSDQMIARATGVRNPTAGLSNDSYDWIVGQMQSGVKSAAVQAKGQDRVALSEINEAQKQIKSGYDLPEQSWNALNQKFAANTNPDVQRELQLTGQIRSMFSNFKGKTPQEIEATLTNAQAEMAKSGVLPQQKEVFDAAKTYLDTYRDDLNKDMLGRAAHEGVLKGQVTPLSVTDPTNLRASLQARIPQAEHAGEYFGTTPQYLQPNERAAFKTLAAKGGPQMIEMAGALAAAAGPKVDAILKEIGGDAPKFATAAKLSAWSASPGFLADFGERQRLNNDPATRTSLEMPARNAADKVFSETFGDAMAALPGMNAATRVAAKDVFEVRALRDGHDRAVSTSTATEALKRTAQEAAGATFDGDAQYGGVGTVKGGWTRATLKVLAPLNMKADAVGTAINALTDADLAKLGGAVRDDLKTPAGVDAIKTGYLVSVGHGQYQVTQNDPKSRDPQYVLAPDGKKFLLDLNRLEPELRFRAPSLYRGGK